MEKVIKGRKCLPDGTVEKIRQLYNEGYTCKYICRAAHVSLTTVMRYVDKNRKVDNKWTKEENEKLMRLKKQGMSCEDIACILGKTKIAVQTRYSQIKTGRYKIKN